MVATLRGRQYHQAQQETSRGWSCCHSSEATWAGWHWDGRGSSPGSCSHCRRPATNTCYASWEFCTYFYHDECWTQLGLWQYLHPWAQRRNRQNHWPRGQAKAVTGAREYWEFRVEMIFKQMSWLLSKGAYNSRWFYSYREFVQYFWHSYSKNAFAKTDLSFRNKMLLWNGMSKGAGVYKCCRLI